MSDNNLSAPVVGVIYEPEYTSPAGIETDIRMMKDMGIGLVFTGGRLLFRALSEGEGEISALCDIMGRLNSAGILAVVRLPLDERPASEREPVTGKRSLLLPKAVSDGLSAERYLPNAERAAKALSRYSNLVGWQICCEGSLPCDESVIFEYMQRLSPLPVCMGDDGGCGIFRTDEGRRDTLSVFSKEPCVENLFFVSDFARTARGEFFFQYMRNDLGGFMPNGSAYAAALLPVFSGAGISIAGHWKGRDPSCIVSPYNRPSYLAGSLRKAAKALSSAADFFADTRVVSDVALLRRDGSYDAETNEFVKALHRAGCCPDVTDELSFDRYSLIFTPYCPSLGDEASVTRLAKWVENGGIWVAGPESDTLDHNGEPSKKAPFVHLEKYASVFLRYDIKDGEGRIKGYLPDGTLFAKGGRCMLFDPDENDFAIISQSDPAVDGKSCAKCVPYGKGRIILLGMTPTEEGLDTVIKKAFLMLRSAPAVTLGKVAVSQRMGSEKDGSPIWGATVCEYGGEEGIYHCPCPALDLISGRMLIGNVKLTPYEALVLKFIQ